MALAASCGIGAEAMSPGSAITSDGRTRRTPSTPSGSRWKPVSSAPESVVGTAATGSESAAPIAFAESITLPPPSAATGRPPTSGRAAAETSATGPGPTRATASAAPASAWSRKRSVVSSAYPSNPRARSSPTASSPAPPPNRISRSPSPHVKPKAGRGLVLGRRRVGPPEVVLGLGHGRVRQGVRQSTQVRAPGRLEDVGRDTLARGGHAAELEQDRDLTERVRTASHRAHVVLLQASVVPHGRVDRVEERVDRPVAREAALRELAARHPHCHLGQWGPGVGSLDPPPLHRVRLGHLTHLVRDQGLEIERRDLLLLVRHVLEALERRVQRRALDLVAELLERLAQRMPAGVFAEHDRVRLEADRGGVHDLVGRPLLQHAVLVDAGLVRERVSPDDRLVGLHRVAGKAGDQPARAGDLARVYARGEVEGRPPRVQQHHDLLERRVARPLADPVHGALDLTRSGRNPREGVRHREPEVVVAVHRKRDLVQVRNELVQAPEGGRVLVRHRVPDGVRNVDGRRTLVERDLHHLGGVLEVGARGIHRRELHVVGVLLRVRDRRARLALHVLARRLELVLDVDVARRDEGVDARPLGIPDRVPGGVDVLEARAGEPADARAVDLARDRLHRLEVAWRGDREAGLDHVHPEPPELVGDLELLDLVQRDARRLLAVAQRGVEDAYVICSVVHAFPFGSLPRFSSSSACGSAAATRYSPRGGRRRSRRRSRWNCMRYAAYTVSTTFPTFFRSPRNRCASPPRSSGNASATTGRSLPASIHSRKGVRYSSNEPFASHRRSMFRPITARELRIIDSGWKTGVVAIEGAMAPPFRFSPLIPAD